MAATTTILRQVLRVIELRTKLRVALTAGGSRLGITYKSLMGRRPTTVGSRRRSSTPKVGATRRCIVGPLRSIETWAIDQARPRRTREQRQIPRHTTRSGPFHCDPTSAPSSPRDNSGSILDSRRGRRAGCSPRLRLCKFDIRAPRAPPPSRRRRPWRGGEPRVGLPAACLGMAHDGRRCRRSAPRGECIVRQPRARAAEGV